VDIISNMRRAAGRNLADINELDARIEREESRPESRSAAGLSVLSWVLVVLALAVPAAIALAIQLSAYPNHDVAWVLWGSREMLHGAQYGRDIIEPNPPLAWYLSMPTTALAMALGVPLDRTFTIFITLAGVLSAASLIWLRPRRLSIGQSAVIAMVAVTTLLTMTGREFGQREPLMMILVLPYLALAGRRFDGASVPGPRATIAIGVIAGLGFALKPYFLAVPLLIEVVLKLWGKKPLALFRGENLSAAAVILAYGLWVILSEKPYLYEIIPLVREIYWSFNYPVLGISVRLTPLILGVAPLAYLFYKQKDGLGLVLTTSFVGFIFSYLIQQKGYDYHLNPARMLPLLLAVRLMVDPGFHRIYRWAALALTFAFFVLWMDRSIRWWSAARPGGSLYRQIEQINGSIARHASGGRYIVITIRTYPNFPAGIYAPARYASRTNAQWFLPAVAQLREKGQPSASVERHAREFVMHDLQTKPDLVLLDTNAKGHTLGPRDFDILKFYQEDPAFRQIWRPYREVEPIGQFRQFVRVPDALPPAEHKA